jgi:hypothetical protein
MKQLNCSRANGSLMHQHIKYIQIERDGNSTLSILEVDYVEDECNSTWLGFLMHNLFGGW